MQKYLDKFDFCCHIILALHYFYRPKYINSVLISEGLTPGILDACPIVFGFILESF